jgi:hypothetical protein
MRTCLEFLLTLITFPWGGQKEQIAIRETTWSMSQTGSQLRRSSDRSRVGMAAGPQVGIGSRSRPGPSEVEVRDRIGEGSRIGSDRGPKSDPGVRIWVRDGQTWMADGHLRSGMVSV